MSISGAFNSCEGQWYEAKDGELKLAKEHLETLSVLRSSTDSCEYSIIGRGPNVHLLFYLTNSIAYNGVECPGRLTILEVSGLNSTERVVSGKDQYLLTRHSMEAEFCHFIVFVVDRQRL